MLPLLNIKNITVVCLNKLNVKHSPSVRMGTNIYRNLTLLFNYFTFKFVIKLLK